MKKPMCFLRYMIGMGIIALMLVLEISAEPDIHIELDHSGEPVDVMLYNQFEWDGDDYYVYELFTNEWGDWFPVVTPYLGSGYVFEIDWGYVMALWPESPAHFFVARAWDDEGEIDVNDIEIQIYYTGLAMKSWNADEETASASDNISPFGVETLTCSFSNIHEYDSPIEDDPFLDIDYGKVVYLDGPGIMGHMFYYTKLNSKQIDYVWMKNNFRLEVYNKTNEELLATKDYKIEVKAQWNYTYQYIQLLTSTLVPDSSFSEQELNSASWQLW